MKEPKLWTYCLLIVLLASCGYSEGDWGATVGDCDEICTVYHAAQLEIKKDRELYDRDFPDKELRRKHVITIDDGHKINSWFNRINELGDTVRTNFSCEVYLSNNTDIAYYVENLRIAEN